MKKTGTITFLSFTNNFPTTIGDPDGVDWMEIMTGVLTTHYKASQAIIDELTADGVKPDVIKAKLAELDKERVKTLTTVPETEKTKSFQEGYKKAKKEVLTEHETAKKAEYGITSDLTGIELDKYIISEKLKEAGAKSEDEIRKTPTYQALETKYKADIKAANDQMEAKVKELETGYAKEQTFTTVGKNAIDILTGLNAILPTNPTVAETQKRDFLNELKNGYEYELSADGKVLVSKGGELLKDEHGHTLSYEDHVKKIATNRFEFAQNNGGNNSGADPKKPNGNDNTAAAYPSGIAKPKNSKELDAVLAKMVAPAGADDKAKRLIIAQKRIVIETFRDENPGE